MLAMRPNCECCDLDLPPDSPEAFICSFECSFCKDCAARFKNACPNCGGSLVARPWRSKALLKDFPGQTARVFNEKHKARRDF